MKKIYLIIILFSSFKMFSQNCIFGDINFEFSHDVYIYKNSSIKLFFTRVAESKIVEVFGEIDHKEFKTKISRKKYDEICEKLINLKPIDIINDAPIYLDASNTEIIFTCNDNSFSYKVSGLNKGDEKTSRKDFLELVIIILESQNIQIRNIN